VYGHRRLFVIGYVWFSLGSLGCGLSSYAPTIIPFDVFRAIQGIGPALLLPNSLAILGRTYRNGPRKALAFGLYGACAPSGFIVGAVFASLLAETVGWQWAYYLLCILCAALAVGTLLVIPADEVAPPRLSLKHASRTLDLPGALLGVLGLCFVNFAFNQAPLVGWDTSYVLVFLILGLLLLGGFLFIEPRVGHPILPYHTFSGSTSFVLACLVGGWGSFGVWVFYYYQQMTLEGANGLLITARASPVCFAGLVAGLATAALFHRVPPSALLLISMLGFFVGSAVMAFRPVGQIYWGQGEPCVPVSFSARSLV
jgi:MFS family permease